METLTGTRTETGIGPGTGRETQYEYQSVFNREMVIDWDWVSYCY